MFQQLINLSSQVLINFLQKDVEKYQEEAIQIYKELHKIPEIGLKQYNTSKYIREYLQKIPNIEIAPVFQKMQTAIIAKINSQKSQKNYLFRCELDALPLKQQSGLQYASENQNQHACGHDAHMTMILLSIKILSQYKLKNSITIVFQPGQQGKAGAKKLIDNYPDILKNIDFCFAIHSMNHYPVGFIGIYTKFATVNTNKIKIHIEGKSTHAMNPHLGIDANFIGCSLVTELYSLKSRILSPLEQGSFSVLKVQGGKSISAISDTFQISATVRISDLQSHNYFLSEIQRFSSDFCDIHKAKAKTTVTKSSYRSVKNNKNAIKIVENAVKIFLPEQNLLLFQNPSFAGQDFCQFSEKIPSCYFCLGFAVPNSVQNGDSIYPLHSNKHKLDPKGLIYGIKTWISIAVL